MEANCPKCGTPKTREACPKCGLVFAKFDPNALDAEAPDPLLKMWRRVVQQWNTPEIHALFVEQCKAEGALGFAARMYTKKQGDPIADRQRQQLIKRMETELLLSATERARFRAGRVATVLLLASLLAGAAYLLITAGGLR